MPKSSLLEKTVKTSSCIVFTSGILLHGAKMFIGRHSIPPLTEHIGDFTLVSLPISFGCTGGFPEMIEEYGIDHDSRVIQQIGHYFPEIITVLTTAYFALGESVMPYILPGSADPKDIPAAIISGLSTYLAFKKRR